MRLIAARYALVVFALAAALFSGPSKARASFSCVCVKFMYADLGYTQIYYALEHPDCTPEQCPTSYPVWYSGYNLPTNQTCPDCISAARPAAIQQQEPKLAAPKAADFDLRQGDKEISLNPLLPFTHDPIGFGQPRTGTIVHPDDGRLMTVKVFAMQVNDGTTPVILFGVEVGEVSKPDFANATAERVDGMSYLYRFQIDDVWQNCVIIASR